MEKLLTDELVHAERKKVEGADEIRFTVKPVESVSGTNASSLESASSASVPSRTAPGAENTEEKREEMVDVKAVSSGSSATMHLPGAPRAVSSSEPVSGLGRGAQSVATGGDAAAEAAYAAAVEQYHRRVRQLDTAILCVSGLLCYVVLRRLSLLFVPAGLAAGSHRNSTLRNFLTQEVLLGITGKDFVLTASDSTAARGIVVQNRGEDKSRALNAHNLMLYSGEPGDTVQFAEYIQCNTQLYRIRNGLDLSTKAVSSFVRKELATSLRSRHPYTVNLLIGGVDAKTGVPELYWIDYLSACVKLDFAAHGYASYFCMSTMDRYWQPGLSLDEAKELLRKCLAELKVRFIGNLPDFTVKVVDKDGIREITI
ncbi:Proteasome subunit beta type-4 [Entophlyctis sp. JEL0112]|nr:Proteasome subunit beta type-4 [Entophlyctis sp. JEL0112]